MPSEHSETVRFANYLRSNGYIFYKSPSETFTTSWSQKRKNSQEGVCKGFPDMCIVLKRGSLLFVELKKERGARGGMNGSVIGEEQKEWAEALDSIDNVAARFAHGHKEAISIVQELESIE